MVTAGSAREAEAHARADDRLRRQRDALRPLGLVVIAAVAVGAVSGNPSPGLHGTRAGVAVALVVFAAALAWAAHDTFVDRSGRVQAVVIGAMGAAGIALVSLQPKGATELTGGAAVWMAVVRLPFELGVPLAVALTAGLGLALALAGGSAAAVLAAVLLCALLALVAHFIRQARASEDRTELLLAQLEDAREGQMRSAALSERARIAAELHDLLAHSLSGAAIQLQAARRLAEHEQAGPQVSAALERAGELVRDGLANARQAVGALRGEELPGVDRLGALVTELRRDAGLEVTLRIEGEPRPLPAEPALALYRGAQEALTNVTRYAPGASTSVVLRYGAGRTSLTVENGASPGRPVMEGLTGVGGGNGLSGLRDRVERTGGSLRAGPTETGFRVELEVPV